MKVRMKLQICMATCGFFLVLTILFRKVNCILNFGPPGSKGIHLFVTASFTSTR